MFQVGLSFSGSQFPGGSWLESTLSFLFYECFHMAAYIPRLIRRMKRREAGKRREERKEGRRERDDGEEGRQQEDGERSVADSLKDSPRPWLCSSPWTWASLSPHSSAHQQCTPAGVVAI